jgi:hypothetical protein
MSGGTKMTMRPSPSQTLSGFWPAIGPMYFTVAFSPFERERC